MLQRKDGERLVESWVKAVESGTPGAFETLVTHDVLDISGVTQPPGPEASARRPSGAEPFEARARALHAAFTGVSVTVDDLVVDGEVLAWRFTLRGEQRGPFLGVEATGRHVAIQGVNFQRIENGRVREHWTLVDRFEWLRQLRGA
jgi:predicted ester cyclase